MITKEKYQKLMDEKIQLERERNKLFVIAQKLIDKIKEAGITIDLSELKGIRNQAGISLIPGDSKISGTDYEPFCNNF